MKPYFGALNSDGKWWDGKDWRTVGKTIKGCVEDVLRTQEKLSRHDADNCHVDGCFECPRCRKPHFTPDNFDLLCDGCCAALLVHPEATPQMLEDIAEWRKKAAFGRADADIAQRYALRDELLLREIA